MVARIAAFAKEDAKLYAGKRISAGHYTFEVKDCNDDVVIITAFLRGKFFSEVVYLNNHTTFVPTADASCEKHPLTAALLKALCENFVISGLGPANTKVARYACWENTLQARFQNCSKWPNPFEYPRWIEE